MRTRQFGFIGLCVLILSLQATANAEQSADAAWLEQKAEVEGFGYKSANLMFLRKILSSPQLAKSIAPIKVAVPDFYPVASSTIEKLLHAAHIDLKSEWAHVLESAGLEAGKQSEVFATKQLPQEFVIAAELLAEKLLTAFGHDSTAAQLPADLQTFLQHAHAQGWHLMVRSTGKEDTEKLANAGGNKSVPNVSPITRDVLAAMGVVLASYFQNRSISQRLGAGDESLFTLPLTPVLIQRMVGEKLGGETLSKNITTGCVLYTEEPNAHLAKLHTAQCSFGHNEGVVQSLVALDTFYINSAASSIDSRIRPKAERLVPVFADGIFGLQAMTNPNEIKQEPSLTKNAVLALGKIADHIHDSYGKPMDLELAFIPKEQTFYVFQARPIISPKAEGLPNYTRISTSSTGQVIPLFTINPGDNRVETITSADMLLLNDTLEQALDRYTSPGFDKTKVRVVIAKEQADATSHAAATFRGEGKAIFVSDHLSEIEKIEFGQNRLLLDKQRGLLLQLTDPEYRSKSYAELTAAHMIVEGWNSYPLPLVSSIGAFGTEQCIAHSAALFKNDCVIDPMEDQAGELADETTKQRNASMKKCAENDAECHLQKSVAEMELPKLEALNTRAHELIDRAKHSNGSELEQLYSRKFLEALLLQKKSAGFVDTYSYATVKEELARAEALAKTEILPLVTQKTISGQILTNPEQLAVAIIGLRSAFSPKVRSAWLRLIDTIASKNDPQSWSEFRALIDHMRSFKALGTWLNLEVDPDQHLSMNHYLKEQKEFKADEHFLSLLLDYQTKLDAYDLQKWTKPSSFRKNQEEFQQMLAFFTSAEFLSTNYGSLAQATRNKIMEIFVHTFDLTIKTLKSTPDYTEKAQHFKIRIQSYLQLLQKWSNKPFSGREQQLAGMKPSDKQFFPSKGFDVRWAVGKDSSEETWGMQPETLEDMFMTVHQSLNELLAQRLKATMTLGQPLLPAPLVELQEFLSGLSKGKFAGIFTRNGNKTSLIGFEFGETFVKLRYTTDLGGHGIRTEFFYDQESAFLSWQLYFFGGETWGREKKMRSLINQLVLYRCLDCILTESWVVKDTGPNNTSDFSFTMVNITPDDFIEAFPRLIIRANVGDLHDEYPLDTCTTASDSTCNAHPAPEKLKHLFRDAGYGPLDNLVDRGIAIKLASMLVEREYLPDVLSALVKRNLALPIARKWAIQESNWNLLQLLLQHGVDVQAEAVTVASDTLAASADDTYVDRHGKCGSGKKLKLPMQHSEYVDFLRNAKVDIALPKIMQEIEWVNKLVDAEDVVHTNSELVTTEAVQAAQFAHARGSLCVYAAAFRIFAELVKLGHAQKEATHAIEQISTAAPWGIIDHYERRDTEESTARERKRLEKLLHNEPDPFDEPSPTPTPEPSPTPTPEPSPTPTPSLLDKVKGFFGL